MLPPTITSRRKAKITEISSKLILRYLSQCILLFFLEIEIKIACSNHMVFALSHTVNATFKNVLKNTGYLMSLAYRSYDFKYVPFLSEMLNHSSQLSFDSKNLFHGDGLSLMVSRLLFSRNISRTISLAPVVLWSFWWSPILVAISIFKTISFQYKFLFRFATINANFNLDSTYFLPSYLS